MTATLNTPKRLPEFANRLADVLADEIDATVEAELTQAGGCVRFHLLSDNFYFEWHMERQRRIWAVVRRTVDPEDQLMITLIVPFIPQEWGA